MGHGRRGWSKYDREQAFEEAAAAAGSESGGRLWVGLCGVHWGSLGPGSAELFFLAGMTAVRRGRRGRSLSVTPRGWRCRWGMGEAAIWRRTRPLWKRQTWRGERCSTWCTTVAGTSGKTGPGEKSPNVYIHPKERKIKRKTPLNLWDHRYTGYPYSSNASLPHNSASSNPVPWSVLWLWSTLGPLVAETELSFGSMWITPQLPSLSFNWIPCLSVPQLSVS